MAPDQPNSNTASDKHNAPNPRPPPHYPNPRETVNPDAVTLRDQWKYATRQYSRWYSRAWGAAVLGGMSLFAVGWIVKGENPLPSGSADGNSHSPSSSSEKT
eukprot:Gb_08849 [translate_table: standard]